MKNGKWKMENGGFSPIFYFKRRDTNFNLPQEYLDLHALHSFNAIFRD